MTLIRLRILGFLLVSAAARAAAEDFIAGADLSHLIFFENRGVVYRADGQPGDALDILKGRGLNCVRLRLFTSSPAQAQADPYNYTNNLDYTLPLAVRVKTAGLKFLLDFHYSDTWADPGKQAKPAAWTNFTFVQLEAALRAYNSNCIAVFSAAGAMPDYVQIGNEITSGMLWPSGRVGGSYDSQWPELGRLMKAAVNGVKDAAGTNMPRIIIHIDRGGDWATTRWYFDNVQQQQVPFDYIGQSYYPWWHGSLEDLRTCLSNAAVRYDKPIIVAETAFPWANSTNIFDIPATTNGQVQFVTGLARVIKSLPRGKGVGIFWWGTEYQRVSGVGLAGFDRRSFFGSGNGSPVPSGGVLPVAVVFGRLAAPLTLRASRVGGELNMTWPLSGAGMALTATADLQSPEPWAPVTNPVLSDGGIFTTTVPMNQPQRFFRLQSN